MSRVGLAAILTLLALSGCRTQPTKVSETTRRDLEQVVEKAQKPLELSENTVVLDVRTSFDYGLNKIRNSQNFQWENLAENAESGELLRDSRQAGLRLSLRGLHPETPVVIVGYGRSGKGEEGRLAWNLIFLGLQDVQVSSIESFRKSMTPNESPAVLNEKPWTVQPRAQLQVSKPEFSKLVDDPRSRLQSRTYLIDVRSEKEYLSAGQKDFNALNIEWKQFYNLAGRPDSSIVKRLSAQGIKPGDRIILYSNRGVRSASAAYALMALGFKNVQNFTGGLNSLK